MAGRSCVWALLCACGLLLAESGCARPALIADDAVVLDGRTAPLNAYTGHLSLFDLHDDIYSASVAFEVGERRVGEDLVDDAGHAFVLFDDFPGAPASFQARSKVLGQHLGSAGRIFRWRTDRVILAIDLDYCIVQTNYVRLLFGKHIPVSPPFADSREVLTDLSKDYQILYLTARPRSMTERTRQWLDHYGFPPGPLVVSDHFADVLHQLEWKRDTLKRLHLQYPSLLVSLGNRKIDIESALPNHILPVLVRSAEIDAKDEPGNLLLEDWRAIGEFFRVNRQTLIDPDELDAAIRNGAPLLQPVRDEAGQYLLKTKHIGGNAGGK